MRQALFYAPGDVRVERVAIPHPGPGEVLVRVEVALVCGTDAKTFRRGHPVLLERAPAPFGHEYAGIVEEVGEGVESISPGDRVTSANSAPCGHCFFCRRGQDSLCENLQPFLNGAYADYLLVPERIVAVNMFRVPEGMEPEQAALVEPFSCVLKGLEVTEVGPGVTVGVLGLGPIGLMMTHAAVSQGAEVIAIGRHGRHLGVARDMGAQALVDTESEEDPVAAVRSFTEEGRGADFVVEAVGSPEAWSLALAMVRAGGVVNFFGGCEEGTVTCVDTYRVHYEELRLASTFHHSPRHVRMAMDLLGRSGLLSRELLTHRYTLDELDVPLRVANKELSEEGFIKAAVFPARPARPDQLGGVA